MHIQDKNKFNNDQNYRQWWGGMQGNSFGMPLENGRYRLGQQIKLFVAAEIKELN